MRKDFDLVTPIPAQVSDLLRHLSKLSEVEPVQTSWAWEERLTCMTTSPLVARQILTRHPKPERVRCRGGTFILIFPVCVGISPEEVLRVKPIARLALR